MLGEGEGGSMSFPDLGWTYSHFIISSLPHHNSCSPSLPSHYFTVINYEELLAFVNFVINKVGLAKPTSPHEPSLPWLGKYKVDLKWSSELWDPKIPAGIIAFPSLIINNHSFLNLSVTRLYQNLNCWSPINVPI